MKLSDFTHRATRELVWGTAVLVVFLGMLATSHAVPETLSALVFALVVNPLRLTATTSAPRASAPRKTKGGDSNASA